MSDAPAGTLALVLAASVVAAALLGPLLPLGSPDEVVGRPFAGPDAAHPLGTELPVPRGRRGRARRRRRRRPARAAGPAGPAGPRRGRSG
ncbi:hypothetical protein [Clavibacter michiganensis]|uniref:hypothetical protein n=1 Tax=Clavibacter michiganensis TaxID=28447 RepID=UPI001FB430DE|nr:hypothetical protein [Clavibacter michiganensis]